MKLFAEIDPGGGLRGVMSQADVLSGFDGFDIPDSPLGRPAVLPAVLAQVLIERLEEEKTIIVNQRLLDVDELHLRSLIMTAVQMGVWLLLTQGDQPAHGKGCGLLSSEAALLSALSEGVHAGLIVSFRKPQEEQRKRLSLPASFFLGINLRDIAHVARDERLIPYVLVRTERNAQLLGSLEQPSWDVKDAKDLLGQLEGLGFRAVLLSSPRDTASLADLLRWARNPYKGFQTNTMGW
ncbi:MAG: hypothetical protein ACP5UI_03565 [Thermoprotei archaeon]